MTFTAECKSLNLDSPARTSTLELLKSRKRTASKPGHRDDGRTLALVIEGGAMRGVVSAGMVCALEQMGLRDCFDAVYGASAGAICAAYFVAGQARYGASIFYEDINNRQFIDLRRLLLGRPVVSLEYLLDEICALRKPLAFDRILAADVPLRVLAASVSRKQPVTLGGFASSLEVLDALRASARIPYFAGPPVPYRGDRLFDASLYVSIPFQAAINDDATDLVILRTRQAGSLRRNPSWVVRSIVAPYLRRLDPGLWKHYLARPATYRCEIETIQEHIGGRKMPEMVSIQISGNVPNIGPFELDRHKLMQAAQAGYDSAWSVLGLGDGLESTDLSAWRPPTSLG